VPIDCNRSKDRTGEKWPNGGGVSLLMDGGNNKSPGLARVFARCIFEVAEDTREMRMRSADAKPAAPPAPAAPKPPAPKAVAPEPPKAKPAASKRASPASDFFARPARPAKRVQRTAHAFDNAPAAAPAPAPASATTTASAPASGAGVETQTEEAEKLVTDVPEAQQRVPQAQLDVLRQRYGDYAQTVIVRVLVWETWRTLWSSDIGSWFYRLGPLPSLEARQEHAFKLFHNSARACSPCVCGK